MEARKKKRQGAEYAKLTKRMQLESDSEQQKQLAQKAQERALMGDDSNLKTETSAVLIGELPQGGANLRPPSAAQSSAGSQPGLGFTPTGNMEQDWVNLLMLSPLFKQISDLEEMLEKSDLSSDQPVRPHVKGEAILYILQSQEPKLTMSSKRGLRGRFFQGRQLFQNCIFPLLKRGLL